MNAPNLGKLISVHGTAPSMLQRAAIVAVLSFVFFLAMLIAFLVRRQVVFFVLAAAFLVVNLFTMIGFLLQKRSTVNLYENGLKFRGFSAAWNDIRGIDISPESGITISKIDGQTARLNRSIADLDTLARILRSRTAIPAAPQRDQEPK